MNKGGSRMNVEERNEVCWQTEIYGSDCDCSSCSHHHECSGYDDEEED